MELKNLIDVHLDLERLSKDLDELGHEGRLWAIDSWGKTTQARLFDAAKGFRKITLDDFVPAATGGLVEVIHHGHNTLPVQSHFQKRFCRPPEHPEDRSAAHPEAHDVLWGYNYQSLSPLTGPGYFVVHPAEDEGEVAVDYTMLPEGRPKGWPEIIPNSARLGRFVHQGMVDVMRGISTHVSIGRVKRRGRFGDVWFMLVREDPKAAPS
jgi:hypothetical protein